MMQLSPRERRGLSLSFGPTHGGDPPTPGPSTTGPRPERPGRVLGFGVRSPLRLDRHTKPWDLPAGGVSGLAAFPGPATAPNRVHPYPDEPSHGRRRQADPDLRHDPARRRAVAGREHEPRREARGGPG